MIWSISDLHLSFASDKPMDIFGPHWVNHHSKIEDNWRSLVAPTDTILVPGDISWAMKLEQAAEDLQWLASLPGTKLILKGNHDYWWDSIGRVRDALPDSVLALQNDAVATEEAIVAGSRGWLLPGTPGFDEETDRKVYERELLRLGMSLEAAARLRRSAPTKPIIAMMHYPPILESGPTAFSRTLSKACVTACVYGHLHLEGEWPEGLNCVLDGVRYMLTSCDYTDFRPVRVLQTGGEP
ncbi:metallophosphoesterase [Candidatus Fermentibacterales bacterium]|nr:metallophosphoesterase [Candidatus Fermentibacterales bacterium]